MAAAVHTELIPVRFSRLKQMARSPAHYLHSIMQERTDTAAYRLGRAAHSYALEGKELTIYDGTRRGKEWDKFRELVGEGNDIYSVKEAESAMAMGNAIRCSALAMSVLQGTIERTIQWSIGDRQCQGTPDVCGPEYITDLKTTRDAQPEHFIRQAIRYAYHAQLAWYLDGVRLSGLGKPSKAYIVAVESTPPHPVTVLQLTPAAIDQGARLCRLWWEQLMVCEQGGHFPGYSQSIVDFDVLEDDGLSLSFGGEEVEVT